MGSFGRTMKRAGRKQNKKSGAGWMTGQQAKEVKAGERASMPPPPKPRKPSKPRARSAPPVAERGRRELSTNPGAVRKREPGDFAIDVEYSFLVNAPATTPRRYHDRAANPCVVTVPTHLVLHARFEMATVDVGRNASSSLRQAAGLGTVVELAEQDHEAAMEELKRRAE